MFLSTVSVLFVRALFFRQRVGLLEHVLVPFRGVAGREFTLVLAVVLEPCERRRTREDPRRQAASWHRQTKCREKQTLDTRKHTQRIRTVGAAATALLPSLVHYYRMQYAFTKERPHLPDSRTILWKRDHGDLLLLFCFSLR